MEMAHPIWLRIRVVAGYHFQHVIMSRKLIIPLNHLLFTDCILAGRAVQSPRGDPCRGWGNLYEITIKDGTMYCWGPVQGGMW